MWHILLFSSETEISENQVLRLSDWTACVYVCGQCKTHRLRTRLLMCFQLGTDVSLVQSVERRAAPGEHQPGESVFTPAGAAHGHEPQPHHQKTLLEGNMQLSSSKCMHVHTKMKHSLTKSLFFAPQSPDLYPFLVKTLSESSQCGQEGVHTADRLL